MSTQRRSGVASGHSFASEAAMADMLLAARGYSIPPEISDTSDFRYVVASSHKLVRGELVTASALGRGDLDAIHNLVKVVTRP